APTYSNAPVATPGPIWPHVDVGDPTSYITAINAMAADSNNPYYRPGNPLDYKPYFIGTDDPADARGGELIPETACGLSSPPCQFQDYPGTISFNGLPNYAALHLAWDRSNFFHYVFSVHAIASPKSPYPCVSKTDPTALANYDGTVSPAPPVLYDKTKHCTG